MSKKNETSLSIWESENQLAEIKQFVAEGKLSDVEFNMLCQIGKATNLNPFLREIWAVKYGSGAASIFIGRDGYRKSAQAHPDYDSHYAEAVYSNDEFSVNDGVVSHKMGISNRGELIGAYCCVLRKNSSKANYSFARFSEYYAGNKDANGNVKMNSYNKPMKEGLWDTKPETMIKKVAEAQALRATFQNLFAGTYDDSEAWEAASVAKESLPRTPIDLVQSIEKLWDELYKLLCQNNPERNNGTPEHSASLMGKTAEKCVGSKDHTTLTVQEANMFVQKIEEAIKDQLDILAQKAMEMSEAAAARAAERSATEDSGETSEEVPF